MKLYSIFITGVAIAALATVGIFYVKSSSAVMEAKNCQKDQVVLQDKLTSVENEVSLQKQEIGLKTGQLERAAKTASILKIAAGSFMFPGDYKAITIGSKESASVTQAISELTESGERMMAEKGWADFTKTLKMNDFFGVLRNMLEGLDKTLQQNQPGNQPLQPLQ